MIVGLGIDLCETERMSRALARHGEHFVARVFTAAERAYCESQANRIERYAGRFAAKEAAMKALGTGWRCGVAWQEFEIAHLDSGRPTLVLHGTAQRLAAELGVQRTLVSITHVAALAMAEVLFESD